MGREAVLARLEDWRVRFLRDPAGFIDAMAEPWRSLGLAELAFGAWASSPWHARLRPHWRLAEVELGAALVVARRADGTFLAAAEAEPDAPGLLRLRETADRVEAWAYGGRERAAATLSPWNGWTGYRAARRRGTPRAAALRAAWPPAGPRYIPGGTRLYTDPSPEAYRAWLGQVAPVRPAPGEPVRPARFAVWVADAAGRVSLEAQTWPDRRIAASPTGGEIALALGPGDTLAPEALAALAEAFDDPVVQAVYADEDQRDPSGRAADPVLKTAFDGERLRRQDYVGSAVAARAEAFGAAGGLDARRLAEALPAGSIRHLPRVLFHRAAAPAWPVAPAPRPAKDAGTKVLAVVPTRDRPALLRGCAEGLLHRTDWARLELCIVDNGSQGAETLALLAALATRPGVRVLRIEGPFDYPALNNAAVAASDAEVVALVNDDTWVTDPDWLAAMVPVALRPDVGAVGAKLSYADGRLQHAGVALGLGAQGVAGHPFKGAPPGLKGPQAMLGVTREVSAVTGACLVVERWKYQAVGGLDSTFQVAFNDVDFCLRLAERGWKSVWTPEARMVHLEGASRGRDLSGERAARLAGEAERMQARWGARLAADPFYHPALYVKGERWQLDASPRSWVAR